MPHNIYQVELNKLMLEEKKKNYIIIGKYFFFEHFLCKNAEITSRISVFVYDSKDFFVHKKPRLVLKWRYNFVSR